MPREPLGNEGRPGGIVARRAGYAAGMPPAKERALEQLVLVDGVSEGVHGIYKRTYKRLRANIQQGKPIVMLHNSGGVVTALGFVNRPISSWSEENRSRDAQRLDTPAAASNSLRDT